MKDELLRKIWLTKKARTIYSDRLRNMHEFYSFLNIYYSVLIIGLSIWNLNGTKESGILLLIASTSIGIYFVFVNGKNYLERSIILRNHYIELADLHSKLNIINPSKISEILEINKIYNNLLKNIENHETIDYKNALKSDKVEYNKLSHFEKGCLFFHNLWITYIFKLLLTIIPLVVIYKLK